MDILTLAKWEKGLQPFLGTLPAPIVVEKYSQGRLDFLAQLKKEIPAEVYEPPVEMARTLWGIRFRTPLMNAAGMFKNGECYEMVAMQGAGGYLGGTGTWNQRAGNTKEKVYLPFVKYGKSNAASNFLGLPNDGDSENSIRAHTMGRMLGCPVGWSVMGSPDFSGEDKLKYLVSSMRLYENAGVDFLEINESCPNTGEGKVQDNGLVERLTYVKTHFLDERVLDGERKRVIPVVVKFSNDTMLSDVPMLVEVLCSLGYDGVNFGNTSTQYEKQREKILRREQKLYDYFTQTFGGGVSGQPLRESSLELCARAVEYLKKSGPTQEFNVIRTGGVETWKDVEESQRIGVLLNQWYTGYFRNFSEVGHRVYERLWER